MSLFLKRLLDIITQRKNRNNTRTMNHPKNRTESTITNNHSTEKTILRYRTTRLHDAIRFHHSESRILKLIKDDPNLVQVSDENNELPLHLACSKYVTNSSIINELIRVYPNALQYPDRNGDYPFHSLLVEKCWSVRSLMSLLQSYPMLIQQIDKNGDFPLHSAVRAYIPCDSSGSMHLRTRTQLEFRRDEFFIVILHLIDTNRNAITHQNKHGENPLHIIYSLSCIGDIEKYVLVMRFIIMRPNALNQQNNQGYTPLHYACLHRDTKMISVLLEYLNMHQKEVAIIGTNSRPSRSRGLCISINVTNHEGNTPLHLAIKANDSNDNIHSDDDVANGKICLRYVEYLLSHPYIDISHRNKVGKRALDIAQELLHHYQDTDEIESYEKIVTLLENFLFTRRQMAYMYIISNARSI
jgi:Ankyrin repeats (3 copies)/Ankyrin repeat